MCIRDSLVGLLPANNLCGPALFDAAEPAKALDMAKYTGAGAAAALCDGGSLLELWGGYDKNVYTALGLSLIHISPGHCGGHARGHARQTVRHLRMAG